MVADARRLARFILVKELVGCQPDATITLSQTGRALRTPHWVSPTSRYRKCWTSSSRGQSRRVRVDEPATFCVCRVHDRETLAVGIDARRCGGRAHHRRDLRRGRPAHRETSGRQFYPEKVVRKVGGPAAGDAVGAAGVSGKGSVSPPSRLCCARPAAGVVGA